MPRAFDGIYTELSGKKKFSGVVLGYRFVCVFAVILIKFTLRPPFVSGYAAMLVSVEGVQKS
ncbi:hypothetical protein FHX76_002185 [Lysinibacter cavernae]|uniref:Uncharacterized protein n=1 Tax=Lysinibacter cavernae TaxID=1640652 RepID=A0A7X5R2B0_9MICO|nr:hypothetical protein [Lysinibacter cavernae]